MASKKENSHAEKKVNSKQSAMKRQEGDDEIPSPIKMRRTLDKTFPCPTCSKTYTSFDNARTHFQKMHVPYIENFLSNPVNGEYAALLRSIVINIDNGFENQNESCTVCGQAFSMACLVQMHMKEVHSNENSQNGTSSFSLLTGLHTEDETMNNDQPRSLAGVPTIDPPMGETITPQLRVPKNEEAVAVEGNGGVSNAVDVHEKADLAFLLAQIQHTNEDVQEEQRRRFERAISRISHVVSKLELAHEAHKLNVYIITACKFPWLKEHVQSPKPDFSSTISSLANYENSQPEQETTIRQRDYTMHITALTVIIAICSRITRNKVMEQLVRWVEDAIVAMELERYEQEENESMINLVPKVEIMETIVLEE